MGYVSSADRFLSASRKIIKSARQRADSGTHGIMDEQASSELRSSFQRAMPRFPEEMLEELYDYATDQSDGMQDHERGIGLLADIVEVAHCDYEDDTGTLTQEDWTSIAGLFSDFAVDLDMTVVTYVMSAAIDRHAL